MLPTCNSTRADTFGQPIRCALRRSMKLHEIEEFGSLLLCLSLLVALLVFVSAKEYAWRGVARVSFMLRAMSLVLAGSCGHFLVSSGLGAQPALKHEQLWRTASVLMLLFTALNVALAIVHYELQWLQRDMFIGTIHGRLHDRLKEGTIRVLSVKWLCTQLLDHGAIMCRRQELSDAAFIAPHKAAKMLHEQRLYALSYRWLTAAHPDPRGFHLAAVLRTLRWAHADAGLFWDWASLPQRDDDGERTHEEEEAFQAGLQVMSEIYASPAITILVHPSLPSDVTGLNSGLGAREITTYEQSGWCSFEHILAKESGTVEYVESEHGFWSGGIDTRAQAQRDLLEGRSVGDVQRHVIGEASFQGSADKQRVLQMLDDFAGKIGAFHAMQEAAGIDPSQTIREAFAAALLKRWLGALVFIIALVVMGAGWPEAMLSMCLACLVYLPVQVCSVMRYLCSGIQTALEYRRRHDQYAALEA